MRERHLALSRIIDQSLKRGKPHLCFILQFVSAEHLMLSVNMATDSSKVIALTLMYLVSIVLDHRWPPKK